MKACILVCIKPYLSLGIAYSVNMLNDLASFKILQLIHNRQEQAQHLIPKSFLSILI